MGGASHEDETRGTGSDGCRPRRARVGLCAGRAAQAEAARLQRLRRIADRVIARELSQRFRERDRHQDRRHQPGRFRQAARDGRERQRRLEHHRDRRPGRLPRHRDGACRADRCQDRRPQQVPAAGADEPRVLAELLLHGDRATGRTRFPSGAPKSWADFWDVKAFPGPRSMRNHPGRQSRSGADGRRRGAGQALSARCRSRLQEARPASTSTSMSGGAPASSRRSCWSTRKWCWRRAGTAASTT